MNVFSLVCLFQTTLLVNCLKTLFVFSTFVEKVRSMISYFHLKLPEGSESDCTNLEAYVTANASSSPKENLPEESISEKDNDKNRKKLTLWSQLTLSKLSIVMLGKLVPESECESKLSNYEFYFLSQTQRNSNTLTCTCVVHIEKNSHIVG